MKLKRYRPSDNADAVLETKVIDGVYVMERRRPSERRKQRRKYAGYDRRASADRRHLRSIDEFV
ncbi:hypothetical protein [Enterovibrio baiacu]|uniref:hypothetical protein n=1 Tax=Enterovibrio baiacu TaxID=2491023 RepID=UPI003D0FA8E1